MKKEKIITKLEDMKRKLLKSHPTHYTDTTNWQEWTNPIDGLEYALELLRVKK